MANYEIVKKGILTAMKTDGDNILLRAIHANVGTGEIYGINGSFFDEDTGAILSMAVNDDTPVKGKAGDYGVGWDNVKYSRGTLLYDKYFRTASIQTVQSPNDFWVADRNAYWAQGGISMSLPDDYSWSTIATQQHMPNMYGVVSRSALLCDYAANIWLVTSKPCTAAEFRVQAKALDPTIADGIFLDSGGSTEQRCYNIRIRGDGRKVYEMVSLLER
jgi:hypothetical protein